MIVDLTKPLKSSFLSCEKDAEIILRRLFVEHPNHSDILKRLLVINTKDCLDNLDSQVYKDILKDMTPQKLIEQQYVSLIPKFVFDEHSEVKSRICINFDSFSPNFSNPEFRDCIISFDIICFTDYWDLGNYRLRPLKIAGYIDGLLDKTYLTGIGKLNFMSCNEITISPMISGYVITYSAIHGSDDKIEPAE